MQTVDARLPLLLYWRIEFVHHFQWEMHDSRYDLKDLYIRSSTVHSGVSAVQVHKVQYVCLCSRARSILETYHSPSPLLSLSMSSRRPFCPMSTEWITCRWMRKRLRRCKTPKWSGQIPDSQKHKWNIQQEHLVSRRPTITPARRT